MWFLQENVKSECRVVISHKNEMPVLQQAPADKCTVKPSYTMLTCLTWHARAPNLCPNNTDQTYHKNVIFNFLQRDGYCLSQNIMTG